VSVIDELKGLEDRVARRMQELRPLVDEYRELEQVAERLGVAAASDTSGPPRRTARRPAARAGTFSTGRRSKAAGANGTPGSVATKRSGGGTRDTGRRGQLMEMVKARPGITVREVGAKRGRELVPR
jgi:hypothetical protein